MDRLPLLIVGALLFLALCSAFYTISWLVLTLAVWSSRDRLPHSTGKKLLFGAMVGPPLLAGAAILMGAFYHHMHNGALQHHSPLCRALYDGVGTGGATMMGLPPLVFFALGTGWSWLMLGGGITALLRRLWATFHLQRGLEAFYLEPSPRLTRAVESLRFREPRVRPDIFVEAPIPVSYTHLPG